ncbi:MAG: bifunctional phosphopantothenoylcysteine decarboxylase/phosphopantothenate--cysteine ligase CoaBC [Pseudomonadales bacterium]
MQTLINKRILLGVTGGIAAYKAAELLRRLQDQGAEIRVIMTPAATEFITPLTMQALSNNPVHIDLLNTETESVMGHIELARWADLIIIAPASADFIARLATGHGDDMLTTICLAAECKIVIAPAMNQAMWSKQATQDNCAQLIKRDIVLLDPEEGIQACGETGSGRLMEVNEIVHRISELFSSGLLAGKHVVLTAGPTREAIDPVRYISNHSSGKQGYALAQAALEAGAAVTLISGPTNLESPERARLVSVVSADEMFEAVMAEVENADIVIGVAAVSDYKPAQSQSQKIKKAGAKSQSPGLVLELVENRDIIAAVASAKNRPFTVGFAAETQNLLGYARGKLESKNLDMIVANDVSDASIGFNSDDNRTTVLWTGGELELPKMSKTNVSIKVIELIASHLIQKNS